MRLAQHDNIIGIKEASGNIEQCMRIARDKPRDFLLLSGDDMWTAALYALGGKGVISVLANAFPIIFRKLKEYAFAEQFNKAYREQFKVVEINGAMYEEGNPVGIKYVLSTLGVCSARVRLPMLDASKALRTRIDALLQTTK